MSLTMEQSVMRQIIEMKKDLKFWIKMKTKTKDIKLQEKCGREIFKEKYRIQQTTEALNKYRENI